jgi:phage gp29-like protein
MLAAQSQTPLPSDSPFMGHYPQPGTLYRVPTAANYFSTIAAMGKDDQIAASLGLRKSRALNKPMIWTGDPSAIAFLTEALAELTLSQDFSDGLSVIELGFNPVEVDWVQMGSQWLIKRLEKRDPCHFRIGEDGRLLHSTKNHDWQSVPDHKIVLFTQGATRTKPYGVSALEPCYPHWIGKWRVTEQMDELGEKYYIPPTIALCETDDQNQLNIISANLAALRGSAGVALSGVKEIKELTVSGKMEGLITRLERFDASISKILTGQTLAMDSGNTGSYALGTVHEKSLDAIAIEDLKLLLHKFNRTVFKWLLDNNNMGHLKARLVFDENAYKESLQQDNQEAMQSQPLQLSNSAPVSQETDLTLQLMF